MTRVDGRRYAVLAALVYSGAMSFVLLKLVNLVLPIRHEGETLSICRQRSSNADG